MNGAIHAAAAGQRGIRRVDDHVGRNASDVADHQAQSWNQGNGAPFGSHHRNGGAGSSGLPAFSSGTFTSTAASRNRTTNPAR